MMRKTFLLLAVAATVSGCTDPFLRAGTWHATGVNQANLKGMVADPHDLEWGVDEPGSDGRLAVAAVARFRSGLVKPLPDNAISKIGGGTASAPAVQSTSAGLAGN